MTLKPWGVMPVLFEIGGHPVEAYPVFMFLALLTGFLVYLVQLRLDNIRKSNAIYIALFAIVGGTLGAKLPILIINWQLINEHPSSLVILLSGRTIVGGLLGGAVGTYIAKKLFHIKERLGNQIAIPVVLGMAVGRIGCLLKGCCYGQPTHLPWGIDFGDHILRHPTQIYEMLFDIALAYFLIERKKRGVLPGSLFKIFMNSYMSFRFVLEMIRVEKVSFLGLTDFQWLCIISLIYINRQTLMGFLKREKVEEI